MRHSFAPSRPAPAWWPRAVVYQVYLRSFADSDGDGVGDIPGLRARLPWIRALGADAVWVNPWYPSPMVDGGYDVADYRAIDPRFGTLDDVRGLLEDAHALGLRVLADIVPNHTSAEHAVVPRGARGRARLAGPRQVSLSRRARTGRRGATQQLALGVRRAGLDAGAADGRSAGPVVLPPVRPAPAGP